MKITELKIKHIAQGVAQTTLYRLIASTSHAEGLPMDVSMEASKDAGDKFAQALELALREHGVEILK